MFARQSSLLYQLAIGLKAFENRGDLKNSLSKLQSDAFVCATAIVGPFTDRAKKFLGDRPGETPKTVVRAMDSLNTALLLYCSIMPGQVELEMGCVPMDIGSHWIRNSSSWSAREGGVGSEKSFLALLCGRVVLHKLPIRFHSASSKTFCMQGWKTHEITHLGATNTIQ